MINWALVEQRRVDLGLSMRRLCERTGITEHALHGFDSPSARDDWITLGTLKRLAAVLDLPATVLLEPVHQRPDLQAGVDYYTQLAYHPRRPVTRLAGTAEIEHAEQQHASAADDVATLCAALFVIAGPVEAGALANALDWSLSRLDAVYTDLARRMSGSGLRIHSDEDARWSLTCEPGVLLCGQRTELRNMGAGEPEATEAALLWTLFSRGPVRLDQLEPDFRPLVAGLEQRHLVERRGTHYCASAQVAETLALLTQAGRD